MRWYNKMYLGKSIQGKEKCIISMQSSIQTAGTGTYCLMPAACKR